MSEMPGGTQDETQGARAEINMFLIEGGALHTATEGLIGKFEYRFKKFSNAEIDTVGLDRDVLSHLIITKVLGGLKATEMQIFDENRIGYETSTVALGTLLNGRSPATFGMLGALEELADTLLENSEFINFANGQEFIVDFECLDKEINDVRGLIGTFLHTHDVRTNLQVLTRIIEMHTCEGLEQKIEILDKTTRQSKK